MSTLRKYFFIGIGGFLGAILRFMIRSTPIHNYNEFIPINTLFINITGSFLLALITTILLEDLEFDTDLRLGICTGFLGAYTTFSTLCKESYELIFKSHYLASLSYVMSSLLLGVVCAYLGSIVAKRSIQRLINEKI